MEKRFLFMMCCLLGLLSCRESRDDRRLLGSIEQAWQLCENALPEARERAEAMKDSVQEASGYVQQKYDLLTIRLRDKYDLVPSSPDSAMQTMAYFEAKANAKDKERACYYLGSAYRDLKDYPRAVSHFLRTVDVAKKSKCADTLIWQNALSQLRFLYMLQLDYEEELDAALQAVELAGLSGRNTGCYLMDAASAYYDLGDTLRCLQYLDRTYKAISEEHSPARHGRILSAMLTMYSNCNHYERADTLLRQLSRLPEDLRPQNYELCLAKFHENASRTDSAIIHYKLYYGKAKEASGRYEASAGLQRCYLKKGDLRQAAWWGLRLYETNDTVIVQRAFEETQRAKDAYLYHRDREEEQSIMRRDTLIIFTSAVTGLALLSIVMGLLAFYNFRKKRFMEEIIGKEKLLDTVREEIRKRQEELELREQEVARLGCQLKDAEQTIAASKAQLELTMKELEQRTRINRELTRITLMDKVKEKAEDVVTHFRDVATGRARLRETAWRELMAAIEALYPGFLEEVQRRLNKQMHEPLLHTICLMKIGLKPMQIAKVMDAKIQTVWNRVKRAEDVCGDLLNVS